MHHYFGLDPATYLWLAMVVAAAFALGILAIRGLLASIQPALLVVALFWAASEYENFNTLPRAGWIALASAIYLLVVAIRCTRRKGQQPWLLIILAFTASMLLAGAFAYSRPLAVNYNQYELAMDVYHAVTDVALLSTLLAMGLIIFNLSTRSRRRHLMNQIFRRSNGAHQSGPSRTLG